MQQKRTANKLVNEKSPYLRQHAHNPVNWYPWSDEAFAKARAEDKPVFLSIGYSTCHWCHVMAHESFENQRIAAYLNQSFVSIKVDREERPDIDSLYMGVCQALTGSGGWPLSVFMDSAKQPFYAGTYFPPSHFMNLLKNIRRLWDNDRAALNENAGMIIEHLNAKQQPSQEIDESIIEEAYYHLLRSFDAQYGGFGRAPKFPTPHLLLFLLKYYQCRKENKALEMATQTLKAMRSGGIYDQIGFGFCRYATDRKWLVPHFEKMLYDNALLIIVYLEAYLIVKDDLFLRTSKEIAAYLLEVMRSPEGGFYTAEDADSEGEEGKFYLFTPEEIRNALGSDADKYCRYYNITPEGNFFGRNIPNLIGSQFPEEDFMLSARKKIDDYRKQRVRPFRDEKILTGLNGLALSAFSFLGKITEEESYLEAAIGLADFLLEKLFVDDKLYARYCEGEVKYLGYDEDYAFLIKGLLDLYQTIFSEKYLDDARKLTDIFLDCFYDQEKGGFFQTDKRAEKMLIRKKESYDGAVPSANSIAIHNLFRLAYLTEENDYYIKAKETLKCFGKEVKRYPSGYGYFAYSMLYWQSEPIMITLYLNDISEAKEYMTVIKDVNPPFYESKCFLSKSRKSEVYVCRDKTCLSPVDEPSKLKEILR
jgi:uncharacterized protein YyaL (SSP411 family)